MKLATLAVVVVLSAGVAQSTLAQTQGSWTPEMQMQVKRVSSVLPSPDGSRVAYVVADAQMEGEKSEWNSQIHIAAADGSSSVQLTRGEKSSTQPAWSPDGQWIGFVSSRSGKANVWRIRLVGGEAEMVTDEKGGVTAFEWAPDGRSIAFLMTDPKSDDEEKADKEKRDWRTIDENIKQVHLYVVPVDAPAAGKRASRRLTTGAFSVTNTSWSPDGRTIVFAHQPTPSPNDWTRADVSTVTVGDGTVKPLLASKAAEANPIYSPDGKWIAFIMSETPATWAGANTVHIVPAGGGTPKALAATHDMAPQLYGWTSEGQLLAGDVEGVYPRLFVLGVDGGPARAVSPPKVAIGSPLLNTKGTVVGFASQDFDKPVEAFVARIAPTLAPVQISHVQPKLDAPLGRSEVVTWKSKDGQNVEGILTYPVNYQAGTRVPLLLVIHGGPSGVFTNSFIATASQYPIAAFAANGYAVLRANPRGSSGYGKAFRHANHADWGGGDYQDLMTGVDRVIAMGVADTDRLGVMGWSYGGFMTSWIVTQTKRFKAASAGAPVTNIMSFTGTADIPDFIPSYFGGEYWDVFDKWRAHTAMFNVKGVTTPTLIQHGEADVRVPVSQGYEFYNALKRQGVTTRLTVYPRQPHGFVEPKMTLDLARANLAWFDKFVLGKTPSTSASQ